MAMADDGDDNDDDDDDDDNSRRKKPDTHSTSTLFMRIPFSDTR